MSCCSRDRCRAGRREACPSAPALIEEHDAIRGGVEEPWVPGRAPGPRTPVEHHDRLAERVAARLPIHAVAVSDVEHPVPVGSISGTGPSSGASFPTRHAPGLFDPSVYLRSLRLLQGRQLDVAAPIRRSERRRRVKSAPPRKETFTETV